LRPGGESPKSNVAIPPGVLMATQKTGVKPEIVGGWDKPAQKRGVLIEDAV